MMFDPMVFRLVLWVLLGGVLLAKVVLLAAGAWQ